jgi:glycosyltransferase involved in cell wall biosynthesis
MPDRSSRHIGFWYQVAPGVDGSKEGIFRAFAWILRGLVSRDDCAVTIASPVWAIDGLRKILREHEIPENRLEILVSRARIPIFLKLTESKHRRSRPQRQRQMSAVSVLLARQIAKLRRRAMPCLATDRWWIAIIVGLSVGLGLLAGIVAWLGIKLTRRCLSKMLAPIWTRIGNRSAQKFQPLVPRLREFIIQREYRRLAKLAARRRDIRSWFVATPWSSAAVELPGKVVVSLWDFVFADFPTKFNARAALELKADYAKLLRRADVVVSNSDYVSQRHGQQVFGLDKPHTAVVRSNPVDYRESYVRAQLAGDARREASETLRRHFARSARKAARDGSGKFEYFVGFPFDEIPYFFSSTQLRPHKNTLLLVKAYREFLTRGRGSHKLIMTGQLEHQPEILEYIAQHQLQWDVLSIPKVPPEVHAALYQLASLTVVPTMFEGGLPFPFFESLSVDTPVVMADIPVVRELIPLAADARWLFDPGSKSDLLESLCWCLEHRDRILLEQRRLYQTLSIRNWTDTAREYASWLQTDERAYA